MTPEWDSMIPLTVDSPRPVPLSEGFVVKKGSHIRARTSWGIPVPVSWTWSTIQRPDRAPGSNLDAACVSKSQFSAPQTVKSILAGACFLSLLDKGEHYQITFPTYFAHNLLLGTLRADIGDAVHVICAESGLRADIDASVSADDVIASDSDHAPSSRFPIAADADGRR